VPKSILDFFDPYRRDHLEAWSTLTRTGLWPEGFLPPNIEMPTLWSATLQARMAEFFVAEKLALPPPTPVVWTEFLHDKAGNVVAWEATINGVIEITLWRSLRYPHDGARPEAYDRVQIDVVQKGDLTRTLRTLTGPPASTEAESKTWALKWAQHALAAEQLLFTRALATLGGRP
jgi:hypothetical protein